MRVAAAHLRSQLRAEQLLGLMMAKQHQHHLMLRMPPPPHHDPELATALPLEMIGALPGGLPAAAFDDADLADAEEARSDRGTGAASAAASASAPGSTAARRRRPSRRAG